MDILDKLINLLRTDKGDWSKVHEELQKIVGRKDNIEILLADLIEDLNKGRKEATKEIERLRNHIKLHNGDCLSLNNEIEQLIRNAEDDQIEIERLRKEVEAMNKIIEDLMIESVTSDLNEGYVNEKGYFHGCMSGAENFLIDANLKQGCTYEQCEMSIPIVVRKRISELINLHKDVEAIKWQPIEKAPRDGSDIIGYVDGVRTIIHWGKASHVPMWGWIDTVHDDQNDLDLCNPTHWMLLPKPPSEEV